MSRIVSFEVAGMRDESSISKDGKNQFVTIRPVRDGEAPNLWSVLARLDNGGCEVLADRRDKMRAMGFARRFRRKLHRAEETAGIQCPPRPIAEK